MTIGTEKEWKEEYAKLKQVSDDSWIDNLSKYLQDFISGMEFQTIFGAPPTEENPNPPGISFSFDEEKFKTALAASDPKVLGSGITALNTAFTTMATAVTVVIPSGSYVGTQTPATTFSAPGTATILPPSVATGANAITALGAIPSDQFTSKAEDSKFPVTLRTAFAGLLFSVAGTNSVVPTPAPISIPSEGVQ